MAREVRVFTVTVPTTATKTVPHLARVAFPPRVVTDITVRVPPGPRGEVGFRVGVSGIPLLPINPGEWIVTDNEVVDIPVQGYPTSGDWYLIAYNSGSYTHTLQVRFELDLTGQPASGVVTPIPGGTLSTSTGVSGVVTGGGTVGTLPPVPTMPATLTLTPPPTVTVPTVPPVAPPPTITAPPPPTTTVPVVTAPPVPAPVPVTAPPPPVVTAGPTVTSLCGGLWYVLGGFTPQGLYVGRTVGGGVPVAFTWVGQGCPEVGQLPPAGANGVVAYTPVTTPRTDIGPPHGPQVAPWSQGYTGTA